MELVGERQKDIENQVIGLVAADDDKTLMEVKNTLEETYHPKKILTSSLGCAIGAHTGPGAIGIVFLREESPYKRWFLSQLEA